MTLFEVTQYVCLPIIIGILAMAYPLLLQSISRIDQKYNSSILSQRFKKEKAYRFFQRALFISLSYAFFHFAVYSFITWVFDLRTFNTELFENISSIILILCTSALVVSLIRLMKPIMNYYDHTLLLDNEIKKFEGFEKMTDEEFEVFLFILNYNICLKDDLREKNAEKVYDVLSDYAYKIYEHKKEFHDRFFLLIEQLNEKLCQQEKLSRIHRINRILIILLPSNSLPKDIIISEKTYAWLFSYLRTQLNYDKTDLVYAYWRSASQNRSKNTARKAKDFQKIFSEAPSVKNQGKVDTNKENNVNFEEFHLWLATMVLYKKEYDLLGKLLSFSQSVPTRYPLVPSFFSAIVDSFIKINEKMNLNPLVYYSYSFSDADGVSRESIQQGSISNFLALLLFRLNSFDVSNMECSEPWNKPNLPNTIKELGELATNMFVLKDYIDYWARNSESKALKVLNISSEKNNRYPPQKMIADLISDIKTEVKKTIPTERIDKTADFLAYAKDSIEKNILSLKKYCGNIEYSSTTPPYYSMQKKCFANFVFDDNRVVNNHSKPKKLIVDEAIKHAVEKFSNSFFTRTVSNKGNIFCLYLKDIFDSIEKLVGPNNDKFIIINFSEELREYMQKQSNNIEGLLCKKDGNYNYKGIEILNFKVYNYSLVHSKLAIIQKKQLPYIKTLQPTKDEMELYFSDEASKLNKELGIYASVMRAKDNELIGAELINKYRISEDNIDNFCIASAYYNFNIIWAEDAKPTIVRILDKYNENEVESNLKDVKPLPLPKEEEK